MSISPCPRLASAAALAAFGCLILSTGAAHAQAPTVNGNALVQTVPCGESDATVNGSDNRIAFTGACRGLAVDGDNNHVQIDLVPGARVAVAGHGNRVAYTRPPAGDGPNVALDGSDNEVVARRDPPTGALVAEVPAVPTRTRTLTVVPMNGGAGPMLLAANQDRETVDCTGRDVLIRGSDSQLRLLGGCRSISDEGGDNLIDAQLQPGARVVIGGPGVTLRYSLIVPGPAPVIAVTANNSTASEVAAFTTDIPVIIAQPR